MPRKTVLFIALLMMTTAIEAKPWWLRGSDTNETDFLPPDVAFRVGASVVDATTLRIRWVIADGYYLYKQKIDVNAESPDLIVGVPVLPPGLMKTDRFLGRQEIYTQQFEAEIPYSRHDFGAHPIQVKVTYQGCAEAGLCYPPISKVLFPAAGAPPPANRTPGEPHEWQLLSIFAGLLAFLLAGFTLRRGRKLPPPAQ